MDRSSAPSDALWSSVLDLCDQLRELAPWQWVEGEAFFGVRDKPSGDIDWCVFIGEAGEAFGLVAYPGTEGWESAQRMVDMEIDPFDTIIHQRALSVLFVDREDTPRAMRELLKRLGRRYHGRGVWPDVSEHVPGFMSSLPGETALMRFRETLARALEVARAAQGDRGLLEPDAEGRLLVALDSQCTVRQIPPPVGEIAVPALKFDEVRVARILKQAKPGEQALIVDWFPTNAFADSEQADEPPHVVLTSLVLCTSGAIAHVGVGTLTTIHDECSMGLLESIERLGLPQVIVVRREVAIHLFEPLAHALRVPIRHDPSLLEPIAALRDSMQSFLGRS